MRFEYFDFAGKEFSPIDRMKSLPKLACIAFGLTHAEHVGETEAKAIAITLAQETLLAMKRRIRTMVGIGGRSALQATSPCPTCKEPNRLTPADLARGYQCDACAGWAEKIRG